MGWWARGTGELAFEVGEFLFYAVGAGEVAVERIESEIVGASSENCCIRKVKSELALEGESRTQINDTVTKSLSDEFCNKSFA
jgi:hypothetical protein